MSNVHISAARFIPAPAQDVYTYLADHVHHHPHLLPPEFSDFRVEEGGYGAGTIISYRFTVAGQTGEARARVDEPEPGRVMTETLEDSGVVTTFTVLPQPGGSVARISTDWPASPGGQGVMEHLFLPYILGDVYNEELQNLESYARHEAVLHGDDDHTAGIEGSGGARE
jgi:hypothetical protein